MTEPTQEQIRLAQEAGNAAYEDCTGSLIDASFAYRAAYDATLAQLQAAAAEVGVTAKWTPAPSTAEMIRIVQDAMQNDPPIEY